jgi:dTDP-glucose 4,6-dehydratase
MISAMAIDAGKLAGQRCGVAFESGLEQTVHWYLDHEDWWRDVTTGANQAWIARNYGARAAV